MISKNKTTRLAIIGCGAIAESFYLPALMRLPQYPRDLILVDTNSERTQALGDKFGVIERTQDYRELLNKPVDGVIITTPHRWHYPITKAFLEQGVPVLCEKPLTENRDEAEDLIRLAQKNQVTLAVNHTRRLFPSYRKIKELIAEGIIGEVESITYYEGGIFNWPTSSGFYFDSKKTSRGVLLDRGPHVIDLICWWLDGKPDVIESENDSYGGPEAVASVTFKHNRCIGEVKLSWLSLLNNRYRIEGTKGSIEGGVLDWRSFVLNGKDETSKTFNLPTKADTFYEFGYELIDNFVAAIQSGRKPLVIAEDILDSISFIEECYQQAQRFSLPWMQIMENNDVC